MSTHNILINREEAELLTDLLMLTDNILAQDLTEEIRNLFGMITQSKELETRGISILEFRKKWLKNNNLGLNEAIKAECSEQFLSEAEKIISELHPVKHPTVNSECSICRWLARNKYESKK